ncbi:unnamed protein product [Phyllotreta striolata]|uniref:protein-disulfide reductase n=1 Tax=Phyllotreta striolata TaxID=444603 RepID=A0A9N9XTE1_PHYSR|nr:unnamed protein product [Phyllotreta striolata]
MDVLYDKKLRLPDGKIISAQEHLQKTKVIVFFFSAGWVNNTEELIDKIKMIHDEIRKQRLKIEIIYVSADNEQSEYDGYMQKQGRWCALPFKEASNDELRWRHNITCLPQVVVCKLDGTVVTVKGKDELYKKGKNVLVTWTEWVQK